MSLTTQSPNNKSNQMQHLPNKTGGNISIDTRVLGTIQLNQIKVELNPFEEFGKMDLVQCLAPIETSY